MTKPVLLLDVDGVLNVSGPDYDRRQVLLPPDGHPFHPTRHVRPFLRWAWRRFEILWCTAWMDSANKIADWAGVPHAPVLKDPPAARARRLRNLGRRGFIDRGDWKLEAARRALRGRNGARVFWVEDGICDEAHEWLRRRRGLYVATSSFEGVTPAHVRILELSMRRDLE